MINSMQQLSGCIVKLCAGKKFHISQANTQLGILQKLLLIHTANSITHSRQYLQFHEEKISMLNPDNVLKRGYSITTLNGKLIKDVFLLNSDEIISTELSSGIIKSKVEKIIRKKNGQ